MSTVRATVTVSYRRKGLTPPVFLAGTFSDPHWQAREMQCLTDESGEHHFTAQVPVDPGKEYQYKFNTGNPDSWFLDEHATIIDDGPGKRCNLLKVPLMSDTIDGARTPLVEATEDSSGLALPASQLGSSSKSSSLFPGLTQGKIDETGQRSSTPIKQVAAVAAEVAETAAKLDGPDWNPIFSTAPRNGGNQPSEENHIQTPLFAHECFGAPDFVDDGFDHDEFGRNPKSPNSPLSDSNCSMDDLRLDDPTLEKFPSDRVSVLDTLRAIQSSTDEGRSGIGDGQATVSRRTSDASSDMNEFTLSPTSPKILIKRTSRSSFGRPRSTVSLTCIHEEPKPAEQSGIPTDSAHESSTGSNRSNEETNDDVGLTLKSAKLSRDLVELK